MKDLNILPIEQRMVLLKQAERSLKAPDGSDNMRGRLLDSVASWYLFPGTQARPRVLGLWGMTGTGKTHFVRELVRQLRLEDRTFWMDGGQLVQSQYRANPLERLAHRFDGIPYVLVVDEFQHACNKRNGMVRDDSPGLRMFWELVDSGRVMYQTNETDIPLLLDLRDELAMAIAGGMRVAGGQVVEGVDSWRAMMRRGNALIAHDAKALKGRPWVFPTNEWKWMRDLMAGP